MPSTPNCAFTLVPDRVSANAAELGALCNHVTGAGDVDRDPLALLADAPFIGHFCQAVTSALRSQSDNVTRLNEYGRSAADALNQLVAAVTEAEQSTAENLQNIGPAGTTVLEIASGSSSPGMTSQAGDAGGSGAKGGGR